MPTLTPTALTSSPRFPHPVAAPVVIFANIEAESPEPVYRTIGSPFPAGARLARAAYPVGRIARRSWRLSWQLADAVTSSQMSTLHRSSRGGGGAFKWKPKDQPSAIFVRFRDPSLRRVVRNGFARMETVLESETPV